MSGGSFDYLAQSMAGQGLSGLKVDQLYNMIVALREYGPIGIEASTALEIAADAFTAELCSLVDVMNAVEWHQSGDWGPESVIECLNDWYDTFV